MRPARAVTGADRRTARIGPIRSRAGRPVLSAGKGWTCARERVQLPATPSELDQAEQAEAIASLKRYVAAELELELGDLRAKLLLEYVLRKLGPLAYNRGVADAERFFRARLEDLPATCFEQPFTHGRRKR